MKVGPTTSSTRTTRSAGSGSRYRSARRGGTLIVGIAGRRRTPGLVGFGLVCFRPTSTPGCANKAMNGVAFPISSGVAGQGGRRDRQPLIVRFRAGRRTAFHHQPELASAQLLGRSAQRPTRADLDLAVRPRRGSAVPLRHRAHDQDHLVVLPNSAPSGRSMVSISTSRSVGFVGAVRVRPNDFFKVPGDGRPEQTVAMPDLLTLLTSVRLNAPFGTALCGSSSPRSS